MGNAAVLLPGVAQCVARSAAVRGAVRGLVRDTACGAVRDTMRGAIVAASGAQSSGIQSHGARVRDGSQLTGAGQRHEVTARIAPIMTLEQFR